MLQNSSTMENGTLFTPHQIQVKSTYSLQQTAYKKIFCAFLVFFIWQLFHAKAKPSFFAGAGGQLGFPSFSSKNHGASGFGGGGYIEGGLEIADFQTEMLVSFTRLSGGGGLLERLDEAKIGLGAAYVVSKNNVRFLPRWLSFRPHVSVFADIYAARVYKNAIQKEEGLLSSVRGVTPTFNTGLFIDFPNLISVKNQQIVLTLGIEEAFRFDKSSGVYATPLLNLGARIFFAPLPKTHQQEPQAPIREERATEELSETESIQPMEPQLQNTQELEPQKPADPELEDVPETAPQTIPDPQQKNTVETTPQEQTPLPIILFAPDSITVADASPHDRHIYDEALNIVVQVLQEKPDYQLKIIGYANSTTDQPEENESELIPLSQKRAETIMSELEKRGITKERMQSEGKGRGAFPRIEGWKNRRVEFLLIPSH